MKVYVKSFGCAENYSEGEAIQGLLEKEKHSIVASENNADAIVLNICTVKGPVKALRAVKEAAEKYPGKKLVVTGCVTPELVKPIRELFPTASILDTHAIKLVPKALESPLLQMGFSKEIKINLPKVRRNPLIGIVPICSGCLDACAFCSTRLVKGILYSYPAENIISEIKNCVSDGCKEIWLTGQDTACYGFDIKTNLPKLLKQLCEIPGDFKIRLGMGNPRHVPKYLQELISALKHEKMYKFLHLPAQSGNDNVLKAMKRGHNVETVRMIAKEMRKEIPEITLSTDVIVAHPGETRECFLETIDLLHEIGFDAVNIARFSARPNTKAFTMEKINNLEAKERTAEMVQYADFAMQERNQTWIGWEGEALIDEHGKNETFVARNYAYKPIILKGSLKLGETVRVKIADAGAYDLRASLL